MLHRYLLIFLEYKLRYLEPAHGFFSDLPLDIDKDGHFLTVQHEFIMISIRIIRLKSCIFYML